MSKYGDEVDHQAFGALEQDMGESLDEGLAVPVRVDILHEGAKLTYGERDVEYGPPALNMEGSGELKAVFRKHLRRPMSHAELEAIDMALTKIGRLASGNPKRDTYVDAATYMAIAGEIGLADKIAR